MYYLVFQFQNTAQIFHWLSCDCSQPECIGIVKYLYSPRDDNMLYFTDSFSFLFCLVQSFGGVLQIGQAADPSVHHPKSCLYVTLIITQ